MIATVIYHIWRERNKRLHASKEIIYSQLWKNIYAESQIIIRKASRHCNENSIKQTTLCNDDIQVENFILNGKISMSRSKDLISNIYTNSSYGNKGQYGHFEPSGGCNTNIDISLHCKGSKQDFVNHNVYMNNKVDSNLFCIPDADGHNCHPTSIAQKTGNNQLFSTIIGIKQCTLASFLEVAALASTSKL